MKTFVIHRKNRGESIIACGKSIAEAFAWAQRHWPGEPLHIRQLRAGEWRRHAMEHPYAGQCAAGGMRAAA